MNSRLTQKEIAGIENQLRILIEKTNRLREALSIATDAGVKFKYEQQIAQSEREITQLRDKIARLYNVQSSSGSLLLADKIKDLNIEEMGEQDLVNVDREDERELFFKQFDLLAQSNFQYYFISGCSTQMPHSFSEWAILEIAFNELEEELFSILYRRKAESNRVQIEKLPVGRNLEKSKRAFKKYFAEFFSFKAHQTFDSYIQTGLPALQHEYVAFVFDFDGDRWLSHLPGYFSWLITTFSNVRENMPTFLFFFVLRREGLHQKALTEFQMDEVVVEVNKLVMLHEDAVHISPLHPVPVTDLKNWFLDLGERNPSRIEEVIELLTKGLKPEDQALYRQKQQFNMDDIERLQELVYTWYLQGDK